MKYEYRIMMIEDGECKKAWHYGHLVNQITTNYENIMKRVAGLNERKDARHPDAVYIVQRRQVVDDWHDVVDD